MEPVQYATTSDGVSIAYHVTGEGPLIVIVAPIPWTNFSEELANSPMRAWWEQTAHRQRIVMYDGRGTGLSDRRRIDLSLEAQLRDLAAVVDALRIECVALLGAGAAAAAAVAYAAMHPERTSHLILWNAILSGESFYPGFEPFETLAGQHWETFTETFAHSALGWENGEPAHGYAAFMRSCITREAFLQCRPLYRHLDATAHCAHVRANTIVLARRGWPPIFLERCREAAALIPGARLILLEGSSASLMPLVDEADALMKLHTDFLAEPGTPPHQVQPPRVALTARETEVLRLLASGGTGKEIASDLGVSLSTVQRHIANIYNKIGARSRVDAATYAISRGLIDRPDLKDLSG
jgi:DNA-binding CsgD family transcriptional regulator/pimeloyl-ACP methyl ester carboxylesterase